MCSSGLSAVTAPMAITAGAAGVVRAMSPPIFFYSFFTSILLQAAFS